MRMKKSHARNVNGFEISRIFYLKKTFLLSAYPNQSLAIRNGFEIALEFFMSMGVILRKQKKSENVLLLEGSSEA